DDAITALTSGDTAAAIELAEAANSGANDPDTLARTLEIVAEAHFRAASGCPTPVNAWNIWSWP
ncbi:MAG: hypothetical protein HC802_10280, partial [Caldilineaceae bacterium]|nr:hypothetical protein [Caldilineaceae bacterium]